MYCHLFAPTKVRQRPIHSRHVNCKKGGELDHISVGEYLTKAKYWKHLRKLYKSNAVGANIIDANLPIEPWVLGVILGDGCTLNGAISVCTPDKEIIESIHDFAAKNECSIRTSTKPNNLAVSLHIVKTENRRNNQYENKVMGYLRQLHVAGKGSGVKSIPVQYLTGSIRCRREILAGLLDTDGYHDGIGGYDYISKSEQLSNDVVFIARSLGISANVKKCRKGCQTGYVGTYFRVSISGNTEQIPCRVERKKPAARKQIKNNLRAGFDLHSVGYGDFYGFTLDKDSLYLTSDFVVHHNSGKSLYVAGIADKLSDPVLVFQPSREILAQNFEKMVAFGHRPGVFSASAGRKDIRHITFATIGSAINKVEAFKEFRHIIIDECHLADHAHKGNDTMFSRFLSEIGNPVVVGLTATPWKLRTNMAGSQNKFITRIQGGMWKDVIHLTQIGDLLNQGFLSKAEYFFHQGIDPNDLKVNSTGSDYTEASVRAAIANHDLEAKVINMVERLLKHGRKNVLIFTPFVENATKIAQFLPGVCAVVSGETPKKERAKILSDFKAGRIKAIANCGVLTVGFDFPELDTVILARPTKSLSLYYQMIGRVLRPHQNKKTAYVLDMVGTSRLFGPVGDFRITKDHKGAWIVKSGDKQLTNSYISPPKVQYSASQW
jgi:DNA repair protein RadD